MNTYTINRNSLWLSRDQSDPNPTSRDVMVNDECVTSFDDTYGQADFEEMCISMAREYEMDWQEVYQWLLGEVPWEIR